MQSTLAVSALTSLCALAHAAGREVMKIYADAPQAAIKNDLTPVTDADLAAEGIILAGLGKLWPAIPVISEEAAAAGRVPQVGDQFFLVDPLDGTKEFLSRNGEFTINIALIEDGRPVAGVVYAPAIARMFRGSGHAAEEAPVAADDAIGSGRWRRISAAPVPAKGLRVVASRSHRDAATEAWLKGRDVASIVAAGSSLKFCLLAAGEADIYPRFGRTMAWDTAAGHAVLMAAGGSVVESDSGAALLYGKRARGFDNPGFIAQGRS